MSDSNGQRSVNISVGGSAENSQIIGAAGDITMGVNPSASLEAEWKKSIKSIFDAIDSAPNNEDVDKSEVKNTVSNITNELKKEEKNPNKLERWFKFLLEMTPDIFETAVAAFQNPILGVGELIKKIAAKSKEQQTDPKKQAQ